MEWEREEWIREYLEGERIAEIARKHEISRKAVYKWIDRYWEYGQEGLADLSRAPRQPRSVVPELWQERIRAVRQQHPRWGAVKLDSELDKQYPDQTHPSLSTIGRVLKQLGLSRIRRPRAHAAGTGPLAPAEHANEVWGIDFKGWRRTADGQCCHPLTVMDQASRYLLCCQALPATRTELVKPVLERVFREYGLPQRLRSDNGAPFATLGPCGLTELSVWWIELGIECERIEPGRPQQNGRQERLHRTLGEETMQPPAGSLRRQQQRFDAFRREYNQERPHQALEQKVPSQFYTPSPRPYPQRPPQPRYKQHWRVRKVYEGGQTKWGAQRFFVSHALSGKYIAFEPAGDPLWRVWFYGHWLGVWDEQKGIFRRPRPLHPRRSL